MRNAQAVENQFLVSATTPQNEARAAFIGQFMATVQARPDVQIVNAFGQPPTSLAIRTTTAVVDELRQMFGSAVMIEPDELLRF